MSKKYFDSGDVRKNPCSKPNRRSRSALLNAASFVAVETLEDRRLLSLTINIVDAATGASSDTVSAVGQVLNLEVVAVVTGTNHNPAADGVQDVEGSFVSNLSVASSSVGGNLLASNYGAFQANGAQPGKQQDLNGDGYLDDGSNDESSSDVGDYFFARAGSMQTLADSESNSSNGSLHVEIATLTYTVTALHGGSETDIVFVPRPSVDSSGNYVGLTAVWLQDDVVPSSSNPSGNDNSVIDTFQGGTPFKVTDPALIVPPVAVNDTVTVYRNTPTTIRPLSVDVEDVAYNLSSFTIASGPTDGDATVNADGTVSYTPNTGFVGTDSFQYKISDDQGNTSNLATVTINVQAPPPPTAVAQSATTTRQIATTIDVLTGDVFPTPAVDSSVTVTTQPADGTVSVNASNGSITYTPTGLFVGTDTFQYTVADTDGETSSPATVTVTVVAPPPPVAVDQTVPVVENTSLPINVSTGATTSAGSIDPTTAVIVTGPVHGTASVQAGTGDVLYTPAIGYTGGDSFTYTVDDTDGDVSNLATVTLNVVPSTPPTAVDSTASTRQNQAVGIDVVSNDVASTDGGLDPSTIVITTPPADGTAYLATTTTTINADLPNLSSNVPAGQIIYTPNPGFYGTDTFDYTIGDGYGSQSAPATVTITVYKAAAPTVAARLPVNTTLTGAGISLNVSAGVSTTIPLSATGTTVTVAPVDGTATVNASTGTILYTPHAGFVGTDTLTYTVTDIDGQISAPVTESVNVGTTLSTAKGSPRTLVFTDAAGGKQTVSLSSGQTEIFFSGNGSATTKGTTTTVTGTGLGIGSITLTGTTARSSLAIRGSVKDPVTIGGITDTAPLGSIVAPAANLTGAATLASVSSIQLLSVSGADITTTGSVKTPLTINIPTGTASSVATTQTIKSFKATTWATDTTAAISSAQITAPVIDSLSIATGFGGAVTANSSAGSLVFRGTLTGTVNAGTAKLVEVVGNVTDGGIRVGTANSIVVTGTVSGLSAVDTSGDTGPAISSVGAVGTLTVGYLDNTLVQIGAPTGDLGAVTLSDATAADVGTATLSAFRVTGRSTGGLLNSSVLAGTIKSAAVGIIAVGNGGVPQGVAAAHLGAVSGIFADHPLSVPAKETASATALAAYLKTKGYSLGDFEFDVVS